MTSNDIGLYTNPSGVILSDADTLRQLFVAKNIPAIFDLLDSSRSLNSLCCVTPTTAMLDSIRPWLDDITGTLLSIGSGSGLFEMLLNTRLNRTNIQVIGVDTAPVDVFLQEKFKVVREDTCPNVMHVNALLAVYIRRPSILINYLNWFPHVSTIILFGPRNENPLDDEDTANAVSKWGTLEIILTIDVSPWDILQVLCKHKSIRHN